MNQAMELLKDWDAETGATEDVITDTQQLIGYELPADLLEYYRQRNGGSGVIGGPSDDLAEGTWIRLDRIDDWPGNTNDYGFEQQKLVMIGSDGGPFAYCLSLKSFPMQYREVDFSGGGQGRYLGSSFEEFLTTLRDGLKPKAPKLPKPVIKPKAIPLPPKDKPLKQLKAESIVFRMMLSPDGSKVLASIQQSRHMIWDLNTGKSMELPSAGEGYSIPPIGWTPDGQAIGCLIYSVPSLPGINYDIRVVNLLTGQEISQFRTDRFLPCGTDGAISPDGKSLAIFAPHTDQYFLDIPTGQRIADLMSASNRSFAAEWRKDGAMLALGRYSYCNPVNYDYSSGRMPPQPNWQVLLVDAKGKELGQIPIPSEGMSEPAMRMQCDQPRVIGCHFNAAGTKLLVLRPDQAWVYAVDGQSVGQSPEATFKIPMRTIAGGCFVGGDRLVLTTMEGFIVLFDLASGRQLRLWRTTKNQIREVIATPDGKLLLTADGYEVYSASSAPGNGIRVWKVDV